MSWLVSVGGEDLSEATLGRQYLAAVYFTFTTITTVGYGDVTAKSPGACVGSMTRRVVQADQAASLPSHCRKEPERCSPPHRTSVRGGGGPPPPPPPPPPPGRAPPPPRRRRAAHTGPALRAHRPPGPAPPAGGGALKRNQKRKV